VVPVGGLEITGVRLVFGSLLLQALNHSRPQTNTYKKLFLALILARGSFVMLVRQRLTGHTILPLDPTPKINKLTAFRTERTDRIIFPLDWFTAGWTLHES
jgi:hypothetical protein